MYEDVICLVPSKGRLLFSCEEDDDDLSEDELARVEDDPNYTVIDPDDEQGVYYATPLADSDEEIPETSDNSEDEAHGDVDDDGDSESGWKVAGIAIGVVAAVVIILVVVVVIMRKRARRSRNIA